MKQRNTITNDNYKEILLGRTILLCWSLLIIYWFIKICGGNFFEIVCHDKNFIAFCNYAENHIWLQYLIGCISTLILQTLYLLAISKRLWFKRKYEFFCVIGLTLVGVGLRFVSIPLKNVMDTIQFFVFPFFIQDGFKLNVKTRRVLFGAGLTLLFQVISSVTKGLAIYFIQAYGLVISLIYCIDVYFMAILYYLYSNKRRKNMGFLMDWLWGKNKKQLARMKQNRLNKIEKLQKENEEIDAKMKSLDEEVK